VIGKDKSRWLLWPVRFGWARRSAHKFFTWHGWQLGSERCRPEEKSEGCMPCIRRVFGWTLHIGAFKIYFGPHANLKRVTVSYDEWYASLFVLGELQPINWDDPVAAWREAHEKLRRSILIDREEWARLRARSATLEEYEAFARSVEEHRREVRRPN
jgi:hypothetical protein